MASATKGTGSGHLMWPDGLNSESISNDLFIVIEHALRILGWQENLIECPPSWMWHIDWEIEAWFEKLKIERERKYGQYSSSSSSSGSDDDSLFDDNVYFERLKNS